MDFRKMLVAGLGVLMIFYLFREPPAPDYKKKFNASIETVIELENEELVRQNYDPIVRKETGIEVSDDGDWIELYYDTPLQGDKKSVYQKQGDRYVRVTNIKTVSDQLDQSDTTYIENLGIK
ncbi:MULTISPECIES: hypothetical protein [Exiguobacterium]|uniref:Uncharacterized protein n=1 Tax=Exiguobacterium sibiricum (strain DSM 17290 / CCUG 55495 / CIP 109462 / JCM 13490 / 255-15) TaxID=262543 RepID=B1YGG1_EXIS2|nr:MULTISPECIES: hypothetical protein [Exiguobacterium]ACB60965.1 hypothetical protein Exig_1505 [Exiguobacterium sibiricum 255-15]AFS70524.1 Hypothetical protein Eab7_1404 [Exiguobacterium antarcticum B7]